MIYAANLSTLAHVHHWNPISCLALRNDAVYSWLEMMKRINSVHVRNGHTQSLECRQSDHSGPELTDFTVVSRRGPGASWLISPSVCGCGRQRDLKPADVIVVAFIISR